MIIETSRYMSIALLFIAVIIISGLAFYAGSLIFRLKSQNQLRQQKTKKRIDSIIQSIQTIAMATDQKQCELSEACIRICRLLEALPILDKPDYAKKYSALFTLYEGIKDLPTHQARKEQSKIETKKQDTQRELLEQKCATQIAKEMKLLVKFNLKD